MRFFFFLLAGLFTAANIYAQSNAVFSIKDKKTKEPLAGAIVNIESTGIGNSSNLSGVAALTAIPAGKQIVHFRSLGYLDRFDTLNFPVSPDTITIELESENEELEGVTVSSTRSSRTIQTIPTRVELIADEELVEKANMKPGDIRMLLSESTGIQTTQTSATSGNAGIRIQGLDGRYTQVLKDGFPLYSGFGGGLGLLQTPPLDLKRVEIIKGASATLYGGGAIAGLVNLISKIPASTPELDLLVNGTSARGLDVNGFFSKRHGKYGVTLYAAYDANAAFAPGNEVFTAIPQYARYTVNPRLFLYPDSSTRITIGLNTSFENRLGGDIHYIMGECDSIHSFFEQNISTRVSSQAELNHRFGNNELTIKNSIAYFDRSINMPGYSFKGSQSNTYTEINYAFTRKRTEWIAGANLITDAFREAKRTPLPVRNYDLTTYGVFAQGTWDLSNSLIVEAGLRGDVVARYGAVLLPRLSILYKPGNHWSSRLGGGLGYKAPGIFTEESERIDFRNVLPVSPDSNVLERSYGGNWDINYKTLACNGKVRLSINQLFFYTYLRNPLELMPVAGGLFSFANLQAHIDATGTESNVRIGFGHFTVFLGYTFTHAHVHQGSSTLETPLTPWHHTNSVLMYEIEGKLKIGAEAYYYSPQSLTNGTIGRDYWLCGLMAERSFKKISCFVNFENLLNIRQTRFGPIYSGSMNSPQFRDIYAPLDGLVINGGIKLRL